MSKRNRRNRWIVAVFFFLITSMVIIKIFNMESKTEEKTEEKIDSLDKDSSEVSWEVESGMKAALDALEHYHKQKKILFDSLQIPLE